MPLPPKSEALIALQDAITDEVDGPLDQLSDQAKSLRVRMPGTYNADVLMKIATAKASLLAASRDLDAYIGAAKREERQRFR